ncbi:MAG TPA: Asp-tRNA(Asn)/Glu-tRNA(Gln) amidotransferase subunit GatA [Planctomycetota bacterium]|nr:Asp-tRNA(Asn)/Glu-tRNA(Gln) amidotransferase subunit GatA [Planctomycetota bacterium]
MASPLDRPVAEMAARVADPGDRLKAVDLVEESLRRIRGLDGRLHAFLRVSDDLARRQAEAVDARVRRGEPVGPLAGVPLAVKDNIAVEGVPLTCGSRILSGYVPARTATCVRRAVEAGACIVGKTNLDEFAMGSSTENSAFGPSRNPWDLDRVPGGSSGGSAVAVAAGLVPLALGSETGGSVRQPAALCGVVGHKPTYGRVSRSGLVAFASSLDQVGPFGRSTEDAELLLQTIAGKDPLDATSRAFPAPPDRVEGGVLAGLRIGVVDELETDRGGGDPEVHAAVERVRAACVAGGAKLVRVPMPLVASGIPVYYLVATAECSSNLARFDGVRFGLRADADEMEPLYARTRDAGFGAEVKRRILLGTFALSAGYADAYYKRAMAVGARLREAFARTFSACDVIVSATSPFPAFRIGEKASDPLAMYLCDVLTVPANLAGLPAASVPAGRTRAGLPVGVQVCAKEGRDDLVLAVGAAIRHATGLGYEAPPIAGEVP